MFILVRSSVQELQVHANDHQFQTHLCTLRLSTLNRGILPSATDLAELYLSELDAARNEKRNRMNHHRSHKTKLVFQQCHFSSNVAQSFIYIFNYMYIQQYFTHKRIPALICTHRTSTDSIHLLSHQNLIISFNSFDFFIQICLYPISQKILEIEIQNLLQLNDQNTLQN
ncbi:Hypothetical_protein [Hexamita inflata]|uniref:Hypothetical_protein n=1 Tax=Hexamita inflata TaxID=28002 RepID=A0AA86QPX5_9EUKA|nr:Hypothetical protein HINF_LOCUS47216 [Hexamita inflata]